MGDTVEIIGKTRMLGDAQSRALAAESQRHSAVSAKHASDMAKQRAEREAREAKAKNVELANELQQVKQQMAQSLSEKDALILEWMHSNEAFKQLARQYGKKLGMDDAQRNEALDEKLVDVAEEDPKFADTKIGNEARRDIKQRAGK
jgi:hypothetical protein